MSEDIDFNIEELIKQPQEDEFKKAKSIEDITSSKREKITAEKQEKKFEDKSEGVPIQEKLADVVTSVWNSVAVPRGLDPINDKETKILDDSYKNLDSNIKLSPKLQALLGTGIVIIPKIIKARMNLNDEKSIEKPQGQKIEITTGREGFRMPEHTAVDNSMFTGNLNGS